MTKVSKNPRVLKPLLGELHRCVRTVIFQDLDSSITWGLQMTVTSVRVVVSMLKVRPLLDSYGVPDFV